MSKFNRFLHGTNSDAERDEIDTLILCAFLALVIVVGLWRGWQS